MIFGQLQASSAADWAGAIGTFLATVVTAAIALTGYLSGVRQKSESSRNAVLLARGIAARGLDHLEQAPSFYLPDRGAKAVRYGAQSFIASEGWLELMESISELRPQDMPSIETAEGYVQVRSILRSVDGLMRGIAGVGADADGKLPWPDFESHFPVLARERDLLDAAARRLLHPFRPAWTPPATRKG